MANTISTPTVTQGTDTALMAAVNVAFRNLVQQINQPPTDTVDMNNNRVTGVNWPSLLSDAVPLGYLKKSKPQGTLLVKSTGTGSGGGGTAGPVTFTPKVEGYAMFTIEPFAVTSNAAGVDEVDFNAFSIDETDLGLYGTASAVSSSSATTSVFPSITNSSRFGRTFSVGDYIIWNDAAAVSSSTGNYEICQILSSASSTASGSSWVVSRGQLGSPVTLHTSGVVFYRLIPRVFTAVTKEDSFGVEPNNGIPTFWEWAWANKCVCAVAATARGAGADGTTTITNLAPSSVGTGNVAYPGLRTMNGAAYALTATGTLTVGQTADQRITVQSWHSLRTIYGVVRTSPVGADLKISVVYISHDRSTAALIDALVIKDGTFISYPPGTLPQTRQMPYHNTWTPASYLTAGSGFPPNILPALTGALDGNGNLQTGFTVSGSPVTMAPDGEIDFIVTQIGSSTAGANATIIVQS